MKTAISINDTVYRTAEETARRMGLSRSRFYTLAAEEFIRNHQDGSVTARLNEYYGKNSSALDDDLRQAAIRLFNSEDW